MVATAWFSTTTSVMPLPSTRRSVRFANGAASVGAVTTAGPDGLGAGGVGDAFAPLGPAAGAAATTVSRSAGSVGTNHPIVARSGIRYFAATRFTSAALTLFIALI